MSPGGWIAGERRAGAAVSLVAAAALRPYVEMRAQAPLAAGLGLLATGAALASTALTPCGARAARAGGAGGTCRTCRTSIEAPSLAEMAAVGAAHGLATAPGACGRSAARRGRREKGDRARRRRGARRGRDRRRAARGAEGAGAGRETRGGCAEVARRGKADVGNRVAPLSPRRASASAVRFRYRKEWVDVSAAGYPRHPCEILTRLRLRPTRRVAP
jgi:hypothetical protein